MPILELLAGVEDVDPNLADKDGNTPLIFAAQAGNQSNDFNRMFTFKILIFIRQPINNNKYTIHYTSLVTQTSRYDESCCPAK